MRPLAAEDLVAISLASSRHASGTGWLWWLRTVAAFIIAMAVPGGADADQGVWTSGGPYGAYVRALAINPSAPSTLYAGTDGGGVFRSTDSGGTWVAASTGLTYPYVYALAINPSAPSTLYAGTPIGVFKSTDSGGTWAASNTGLTNHNVNALVINPTTPSMLYAGTDGGGVFKSTDSGGTWAAANTGLTDMSVYALAINPSTPSTLYAGTKYFGVFKSIDSGSTWAATFGVANLRVLAINPLTPATLYTGSDYGILRSTDSGSTWRNASDGLGSIRHINALAINPASPATLYAATNGGGVFRSTDSGGTWAAASTGLTDVTVYALAVNPSSPAALYAGTNAGVFKSADSGGTWAAASTGLTNVSVYALAINPSTPSTLYAGTKSLGVFKSTDSGSTWATANTGLPYGSIVDALAIDPSTPSTLYAGTNAGVFKSTDSGGTWTAANGGLTNLLVEALAINPSTPSTLYAGTEWDGVFRSIDSGRTWAAIHDGFHVQALAINPSTPSTIYAGTVFGVIRSTDSGHTWVDTWVVTPVAVSVHALAINSSSPSTLYAGTYSGGVLRSTDSGGTWAAANTGLSNLEVRALALDPTGATTLYAAATTGDTGGVWQLSPPPSSMSIIPIVLDVDTGSAHYTTELALSNAAGAQTVSLTYTPSLGAKLGGGTVSVSLPGGQQVVYPNVITALRALGLQIPESSASASQGGTLAVTYDPSLGSVYATARTTSAIIAPQPVGSAGLACGGLAASEAITSRGVVYALRSTVADRSNLAVYNTGTDPVTIKVTLFSGSGDGRTAVVSDGVTLPAFGWTQFDRVLAGVGMTNAWALLERTSAKGAFGAYGVINDNTTNDGSFVALVSGTTTGSGMTLPVLVETSAFNSEIVLANKGTTVAYLALNFVESLTPALGPGGIVNVTLAPGEQRIIAGAIDFLRTSGAAIGPPGAASYAGAVRIGVTGASLADVYVGARTAAASSAGGQFGLFTPPVYSGQEALDAATLYGLRADAFNRTNVAVLNAGADGTGSVTLRLDAHDGSAGGAVKGTLSVTLNPGQWAQPTNFFGGSGVANGYVTVTRTAGTAPWVAYGVVNDGGAPGQRTGDGAYIPMVR